MAIARPVRALMFAAAVLWCFFLYQIFKPSASLHGPGNRYLNFERDPNLDRGLHLVNATRPSLTISPCSHR